MCDIQQDAWHTPDAKPISAYPFHHTFTAERQRVVHAATLIWRALAVAVILAAIGTATALLAHPGLSVQPPTIEPGLPRQLEMTVNAFDPGMMPGSGLARDYPPLQRFARRYVLPALRFLPDVNSTRTRSRVMKRPSSAWYAARHRTL